MKFWKAQAGLLVALWFTLPAAAQLTSGNITGTVYDQSCATIPSATVAAKNVATGVTKTTDTSSAGTYRFENLPIGNYDILVTAGGFNKSEVNGVNVQLNQTITAN